MNWNLIEGDIFYWQLKVNELILVQQKGRRHRLLCIVPTISKNFYKKK